VGVFLGKIFGREGASERRNENIIVSGTLIIEIFECYYYAKKMKKWVLKIFKNIYFYVKSKFIWNCSILRNFDLSMIA
jgi:hypothetical protein